MIQLNTQNGNEVVNIGRKDLIKTEFVVVGLLVKTSVILILI